MKKRMLPLAMLLCLAMVACAKPTQPQEEEPQTDTTTDALIETLTAGEMFSEPLEPLDVEMAYVLYRFADYHVEEDDLLSASVFRSSGATCEEWAVIEFADVQEAVEGYDALLDYIEDQISSNSDYRPQEVSKLKAAILEKYKNTVVMIIADDKEAAENALQDMKN